jgi:hypothetical protein
VEDDDLVDKVDNDRDNENPADVFLALSQDFSAVNRILEDGPER